MFAFMHLGEELDIRLQAVAGYSSETIPAGHTPKPARSIPRKPAVSRTDPKPL